MKAVEIRFNYEDYKLLPDDGKRYEIVEGDLHVSPSPRLRHQVILYRLLLALGAWVDARALGTLVVAPFDTILSAENVVQPDILFVSAARRRKVLKAAAAIGAPDLVIEILSPSNRELDCTLKRRAYARYGVAELWIVDPDANSVELFRLQERPATPRATFSSKDTLATPTFPGLTLPLGPIFA